MRRDDSAWCDLQEKAQAAQDAELRRESTARQLGEAQKLAAQETSTSTALRGQLAKAKAAGPAAVSMAQVCSDDFARLMAMAHLCVLA